MLLFSDCVAVFRWRCCFQTVLQYSDMPVLVLSYLDMHVTLLEHPNMHGTVLQQHSSMHGTVLLYPQTYM